MIRVAIFTDTMDRSARGTALVTRKLVEHLLPRQEELGLELYLVHSKHMKDVLYTQGKEVFMPIYKIPKIGRILSEALFLWRTRNRFDIIHYPQESVYPLFWLSNAKVVVTVLSHIEGWRDFGLRVRYAMVYTTLHYFHPFIDAVVCASASTVKASVMRFSHISPTKLHPVALGVDETFSQAPTKEEAQKRVHERYKLPIPFILAPGRLDTQKNIPRVVEAYAMLKKQYGVPHALIVGSTHRPEEDARVKELVAKHGLQDQIIHLPYIEYEDMPALYAAADCTVFPSLHEGFGLPILESMAAGTPVITSTVYSMPEVAGGAALLVDPTDTELIKKEMHRLLTDESLRSDLVHKGKDNARAYSWTKMAEETAKVYKGLFTK
jgi:glycosyltransferase involved in cell wall biosynthesis